MKNVTQKAFLKSFQKAIYAGMGIALIISLSTCKKLENYIKHHQQHGNKDSTTFKIYTNVADPLLAEAKTPDGTILDFYGTKDAKRQSENLKQIILINKTDTLYYLYDSLHKISKIISAKGASFTFNWLNDTKAALTISVPDQHFQVNTEYDFGIQTNLTPFVSHFNKRKIKPLKLEYSEKSQSNIINNQLTASSSTFVLVQQCDLPSSGDVYVDVVGNVTEKYFGRFPGYEVQQGVYEVSLPTDNQPTIDFHESCASVADALEVACPLTELPGYASFCSYLTSIIVVGSEGTTAAAAGQIFALCEASAAGFETICKTVGASPTPGAPSFADQICASDFFNRTFTETVSLRPLVIAVLHDVHGLWENAPANGPFPNLAVDLGGETTIRTLTLNPPSPAQGQDYVATADVFCLQAGSIVKFSIVGTDGYTDSIITTITDTQKDGTFNLNVPGAETGVKDVDTIEITLPDGTTITQQASLVFQ